MCHVALGNEPNENRMSPNDYTTNGDGMNINEQRVNSNSHFDCHLKHFVDLYTAALHLRQRMQEEQILHRSLDGYLNDETGSRSQFHNCFHARQAIDWLMRHQLCKSIDDGQEIFQVLEKLKIIHHVCDLATFECPTTPLSLSHISAKHLFRFRLDDGTADQNRSFQQFASIYETYTSLFTLEKSQCRGVDLQQLPPLNNVYDEQPGILLKGDNLARMLALRSGANMQNVERLADDMLKYGLVRFEDCEQPDESIECCSCPISKMKFRNDDHHQYTLSSTHRLLPNKRLDLVALMQNDLAYLIASPMHHHHHHSPTMINNNGNDTKSPLVSASCPDRFNPRTSSICPDLHQTLLNRTLSSYHCNSSNSKLSPSLSSSSSSSNNCCHHHHHHHHQQHHCPSNQRSIMTISPTLSSASNGIIQRRHTSGPACSSAGGDDEQRAISRMSNGDETDCTKVLTCTTSHYDPSRHPYRNGVHPRQKSSSLNSPPNSENRPTADELEKLEMPWCWRSYSLKRDRRGYGLILQGQGPCYVERLDPYGSAFNSGIRINEYIYAIEGVNVLRRSGKEVERLLSMFDKCTIYTVYNRDDFPQIATPPNELSNSCSKSSSWNDNHSKALLTMVNQNQRMTGQTSSQSQQHMSYSSSPQHQPSSSPVSSIDGGSPCSISPGPAPPPVSVVSTASSKRGTLSKHLNIFKLSSRSCSNPSSTNTLK